MKILWLFRYKPHWDWNRWFHMDFAEELAKQKGIELKSYGKGMTSSYPQFDLQQYSPSTSIEKLRQKFKFDIIIMDGRARMVTTNRSKNTILPKNFDEFKDTPKIMIEGDYHNYKDFNWFLKRGVNIILHRHKNNVEKGEKNLPNIKHIWFPCSVDNTIFKPNPNINRVNKFCFIGGLNCCYIHRKKAINKLNKQNLIEVLHHRLKGQSYVNCLQSYVSHVNGSSLFNIETAKMFEIMACGSVLFTDEGKGDGLKRLFVEGSYVTYKRDFSDIISKARKILNNVKYRKNITSKAIDCINKRHTHTIRAQELLKIIKENYDIC